MIPTFKWYIEVAASVIYQNFSYLITKNLDLLLALITFVLWFIYTIQDVLFINAYVVDNYVFHSTYCYNKYMSLPLCQKMYIIVKTFCTCVFKFFLKRT